MKNIKKYQWLLIACITSLLLFFIAISNSTKNSKTNSRILMEVAEQIVREKKPTPTESSRFYAIVARDYYETTYVNNKNYTYSSSTLVTIIDDVVSQDSQEILPGTRLVGAPYWNSKVAPFSPNAGSASRFILDDTFKSQVPPPPTYGGEEFKRALSIVKEAAQTRTAEQGAAINFWGGVPGTEAPAGIWQNRFYDITKKYNLTDKEYSYAQMILAESVADSFMECWKVKYTYWTKRPDMTDTSIETAMPNPPFPGYVSGHSTISFTAATVLGHMFPSDAKTFLNDAEEAKNSRLWAGIHFSYDNEVGEMLGKNIGLTVIQKLNLKALK